jgi:hypothetical protein
MHAFMHVFTQVACRLKGQFAHTAMYLAILLEASTLEKTKKKFF